MDLKSRKKFAVKVLNRIKSIQYKHLELSNFGIDLSNYDTSDCLLSESVAMLFSNNEEEFDIVIDYVNWWLYETTKEKIVIDNGQRLDLTEVSDFVDWISEYSKSNSNGI